MSDGGEYIKLSVSQELLQIEEVSCKPAEELKPDYHPETLFSIFFPDSLQQVMTILPFPYTARFVIATQVFRTKQYIL